MVSFLIAAPTVYLARIIALRLAIVDKPDPSRKIHKEATPYLGGIGICCGIASSIVFIGATNAIKYFLGALLIAVLGTLDDIFGLTVVIRLFVEGCVALVSFFMSPLHFLWSNPFGAVLILGAIVVAINSANLLDNIDGALALVAGSSFFAVGLNLYFFRELIPATIAFSCCGAVFGFLVFNWPKAKIFMGDGGSLVVGYFLIVLVLSQPTKLNGFAKLTSDLYFLTVLAVDTSVVVISRLLQRKSIFSGGKDHITHRLIARKFSNVQSIILLAAFNLLTCIFGILFQHNRIFMGLLWSWIPLWAIGVLTFLSKFKPLNQQISNPEK